MLKMPRSLLPRPLTLCFCILLSIGESASGEEGIGLGPLLNIERDREEKTQEIDALGPFITSKRYENRSELGFRPLFYLLQDEEKDFAEFDFLYPLATYDRREEDWRFQFLFYLLSYESNMKPSGFREKEFTLFPFIFSKSAEEEEDSYFALFPIYGRIKDKFLRDELNFFLFPLYLETRRGEATNYSFLWPFFGYYSGGGQKGFRLWPLFGYRKIVEEDSATTLYDEKFALWPIFISKQRVFYGEEMRYFSVFPLYSKLESPTRTQQSYLWPLFNRLVDREKEIERWDIPWPLINITTGDKEEDRFFPFYAKEVEGQDEEGFFLWPLYRYKRVFFEDHKRTRTTILLFLYSDIREEPIIEGGKSGRRIDLWPLFSFRRDEEGNRSFHFLSLLEPFMPYNEGIERNYSSFWRLYQWKKFSDGSSVTTFLFNTYRMEKSSDETKVDLQPIIPLFSYRDWEGGKKLYFLGGLFGYKSTPDKKTIKLLFIPFDFTSDEGLAEKGGEEK